MSKYCAVADCKASSRDFGTVLFCFPKAEEHRRQWIKSIGKPDSWDVPDLAYVCWSHFESKDILQDETSFRRSAAAVPLLYLNGEVYDLESNYFCRFCARKLFSELMGTSINEIRQSDDVKRFIDLSLNYRDDGDLSNLACDECIKFIKLIMRFIRNCSRANRELEKIARHRALKHENSEPLLDGKPETNEFVGVPVEGMESEVKFEDISFEETSDRDDYVSDMEDDVPLAVKFKQEKKENELNCSFCSFSCSRRVQLASHMKKHRIILTAKSQLSCSECNFTCRTQVQLDSHLKKHKINEHATREELPKVDLLEDFNQPEQKANNSCLSPESAEERSSSEILKCSECPYTCTRTIQLASHKKKHSGYKHRKAQFKSTNAEKKKDIFECEFCDFKCKQNRQMAGHRAFHSELIRKSKPSGKERDHMCSICGKILSTRGSFFVHMKYHNDQRDYPCSLCDKKFYSKRDVTMHIESLHQKKIFECEICGVKCTWKNALNKHMRKHDSRSYKHECSYCGKKFMAANELRLHVWRHTGQQLTCEICGAGYRFNFLLTQHKIRTHGIEIQGVKLYKRFQKENSTNNKRATSNIDALPTEAMPPAANILPRMQPQTVPSSVEETSSSSYSSDIPTNYSSQISLPVAAVQYTPMEPLVNQQYFP